MLREAKPNGRYRQILLNNSVLLEQHKIGVNLAAGQCC